MKNLVYENSIIARADLDSGLSAALASVIYETHSKRNFWNKRGQYPYFSDAEVFEPKPEVEEYYKEGKLFLTHYVPLRYAAFFKSFLIFLLPVVTIIIPLCNAAPIFYRMYAKHKLYEWYKKLRYIEENYPASDAERRRYFDNDLNNIDNELKSFKFKVGHDEYVQEIYTIREHVDLIKNRCEKLNNF